MRIGFVGLGNMGAPMAAKLAAAGHQLHGFDLSGNAPDGVTLMDDAASAAEAAEVVITMLPDGAVLRAVAAEILPAMADGSILIDCSTVDVESARAVAADAEARSIAMLDAPVSGGAAKALEGDMTIMASGSNEAFEKAKPATDAIANKVYRLGLAAGAGSRVKMINQLLAGVHIAATAEAMTLGIKAGVDPKTLYDVICASAGQSWMFENRGPHIVDGDYDPKSAVDIFVKDLGIVTSEGQRQDFPLPLAETALQQFKAAQDAGLGREDDSAVAKIYAKRGDIKLPGQD